MWIKVRQFILTHLLLSVAVLIIVVGGVAGTSYFVSRAGSSTDGKKESTSDSGSEPCVGFIKIETIAVEKDPAGDPEAWIRFDYTSTAGQALNCKYIITFYDSKEEVIRTIPNIEDTFQSPNGQIHNGYSSTPYQAGMTAKVAITK